jgi:hypothetical protein
MSDQPQQPQTVYVTKQYSPEVEGAASNARWLEVLFGIFGVLGIGHVYSGRTPLGIILMVLWWIWAFIALTLTGMTAGIAGCILVPLHFIVPIISGTQARTYILSSGSTGSWQAVGIAAGGGCLLVIIAIVTSSAAILAALSQITG